MKVTNKPFPDWRHWPCYPKTARRSVVWRGLRRIRHLFSPEAGCCDYKRRVARAEIRSASKETSVLFLLPCYFHCPLSPRQDYPPKVLHQLHYRRSWRSIVEFDDDLTQCRDGFQLRINLRQCLSNELRVVAACIDQTSGILPIHESFQCC